jgi:hypothetical protein
MFLVMMGHLSPSRNPVRKGGKGSSPQALSDTKIESRALESRQSHLSTSPFQPLATHSCRTIEVHPLASRCQRRVNHFTLATTQCHFFSFGTGFIKSVTSSWAMRSAGAAFWPLPSCPPITSCARSVSSVATCISASVYETWPHASDENVEFAQ